MTTILLIAAAFAFAVLAWRVLVLQEQVGLLRITNQEEQAWSDKYALDAIKAQAELSQLRRDYAALLAAHHRSMLPVLGGAWRAGLSK